ncbi:OB-fold nucleic acid binding domain-containing protein [Halorubrum ezzemoulense]|uniref:OB-fold nucleic acid binding domain-containing protein n=1 Tax=Halorubrum ezzemoulense TaxID=337243 RepID=A0ABT4YZP2_HALEZ|nr:OB-fold nucleic acid binding domain-containing protein [Halorubrum ezzemoulense]MDB2243479.1 OB-fold nucleic acid binding domain-containing protein [Halorubrum ezzemoulense]MDB2251545.1 OB-fold nucleic acid binding domain-containing protein [Halorubrum ezzemoulense]MDB2277215.1 OB-fold nucleic acid binding domain-containing protein [Halorubrum ezzemoulense]MDB2283925.1 OB-fold nucleic acid binding domain-containing protein [Halorubrum ezzemoulense]MDB2288842.1 OB-fold nucleic acid binding d
MGSCIICGTDVGGGRVCDSHQEDVAFDFRGDSPDDLVPSRFYRGVVDGYAEFGVFVDLAPGVTGLLHRSELDRRLDSLDWEPGDDVFVQVKGVRDNGNVDLGWSIRQADREFRGVLVQEPSGEHLPDEASGDDVEESEADDDAGAAESADEDETEAGTEPEAPSEEAEEADAEPSESQSTDAPEADAAADEGVGSDDADASEEPASETTAEDEVSAETATDESDVDEPEPERVSITSLGDAIGDSVRIEGEVVGVRQTGGPTVFEVSDATGAVDVAAFVEPGVRAHPDVEVGDAVRVDGEVESHRGDVQVESEALVLLDGEDAETVRRRLAEALTDEARPEGLQPLAGDETVAELADDLLDAAEAVRRAVLESRPIVVRHPATADGYVAGAAVERAVLPLIRDEHAKSDAEYHYFTRRPLDEPVYGMDAATNDATRMLQDRDRHDEKLPLFLLVGAGSTTESADGIDLLSVYGVDAVVVDAAVADPETRDAVDTLVSPELADADGDETLSTGALVASLASAINDGVRADLRHLPAVSYWADAPDRYVDLARDAGYDAERVAELREAVALEAYYQSYQDKRELIADLLFSDGGDLAAHVSEQFREKLEAEVETADANVVTEAVDGVEFALLDTDGYTHRYDFPPTPLLLDDLHRRRADGEPFATVGVGTDELYVRTTADVSVRDVADRAAELAPGADIATAGVREGKIEFLSGERDAVEDAVVAAVSESF